MVMVERRQERWMKCRWSVKGRRNSVIVELEKFARPLVCLL